MQWTNRAEGWKGLIEMNTGKYEMNVVFIFSHLRWIFDLWLDCEMNNN
jgi:hypothetical protein